MKKMMIYSMFVCLFVSNSLATYTYEIFTYGPSKSLNDIENILVADEGGMNGLRLFDNSSADINGTSTLGDGTGGIWHITLAGSSSLSMTGGQVHQLDFNNDATATLSGSYIETIWSYQIAWKYDDTSHVLVPDPHITMVSDVWEHDAETNVLTGLWLDGSAYEIQLHDVEGYSPVIDNIQFVPEPMTLALLGFGGFLIHRKK